MENNKFNSFYSEKPVTELIEQLRAHRIYSNRLDKDWFEALKVHLSQRDISTEERQTVKHILSDDFDPMKEIEFLNKQKIELGNRQKGQNHSNLIINPTNIITAERNPKYKEKVDVIYIDPPYNTGNKDLR